MPHPVSLAGLSPEGVAVASGSVPNTPQFKVMWPRGRETLSRWDQHSGYHLRLPQTQAKKRSFTAKTRQRETATFPDRLVPEKVVLGYNA